jgi:hypothetical protein
MQFHHTDSHECVIHPAIWYFADDNQLKIRPTFYSNQETNSDRLLQKERIKKLNEKITQKPQHATFMFTESYEHYKQIQQKQKQHCISKVLRRWFASNISCFGLFAGVDLVVSDKASKPILVPSGPRRRNQYGFRNIVKYYNFDAGEEPKTWDFTNKVHFTRATVCVKSPVDRIAVAFPLLSLEDREKLSGIRMAGGILAPGIQQPGCEGDRPLPPGTKNKNVWAVLPPLPPPTRLHDVLLNETHAQLGLKGNKHSTVKCSRRVSTNTTAHKLADSSTSVSDYYS